jgi:hypothetical protein
MSSKLWNILLVSGSGLMASWGTHTLERYGTSDPQRAADLLTCALENREGEARNLHKAFLQERSERETFQQKLHVFEILVQGIEGYGYDEKESFAGTPVPSSPATNTPSPPPQRSRAVAQTSGNPLVPVRRAGSSCQTLNSTVPSASKDPGTRAQEFGQEGRIQEGFSHAENLADWGEKQQFLGTLLATYATKDPMGALTWAEQLSPGGLRNHVLQRITQAWAQSDPRSAFSWARRRSPEEQTRTIPTILDQWISRDAKEAIREAEQVTEGILKEQLMTRIVSSWGRWRKEPSGQEQKPPLVEWAARLPRGRSRDRALSMAVGQIAQYDISKALPWIDQIEDETIRQQNMLQIAGWWLRSDADSALAWVRQAPFDEKTKRSFLQYHEATRKK